MLHKKYRHIANGFSTCFCPIKSAFQTENLGLVFTQHSTWHGLFPLAKSGYLGPGLSLGENCLRVLRFLRVFFNWDRANDQRQGRGQEHRGGADLRNEAGPTFWGGNNVRGRSKKASCAGPGMTSAGEGGQITRAGRERRVVPGKISGFGGGASAQGGTGARKHVTPVARVKGQRAGGTPNMAAARAVARDPGAYARQPPSLRAARLPRLLFLLAVVAAVGPREGGGARLYREGSDAVWLLDSGSVRSATGNSSAAWLVQFHSSWCGHCIGYAPTWRALAADVRGEGPARRWTFLRRNSYVGEAPQMGPMAFLRSPAQNTDFNMSPTTYPSHYPISLTFPIPSNCISEATLSTQEGPHSCQTSASFAR